jgi:hypothetical protein
MLDDRRLDWLAALTSAGLVGGAWIDAWYHHRTELESFLTPAHAVLYAGFGATAAVLIMASIRAEAGRFRVRSPVGYGMALIGVPLFLAGGLGDSIWHALFGIEEEVDALVSPTHLILGLGAALMAGGPLVAAWVRSGSTPPAADRPSLGWPAVISLSLVVSMAAFFTAFANPLGLPLAAGQRATELADLGTQQGVEDIVGSPLLAQALGVASLLLLAAIVVPAVLFAVLRWRLPAGALAVMLGIGVGASALPHEILVFALVAIAAGLAADGLVRLMGPGLDRPPAVAALSFLVPVILVALYFVAIQLTVGIAWPLELWTGSIVAAGGVGLVLALLVLGLRGPPVGQSGTGADPPASG